MTTLQKIMQNPLRAIQHPWIDMTDIDFMGLETDGIYDIVKGEVNETCDRAKSTDAERRLFLEKTAIHWQGVYGWDEYNGNTINGTAKPEWQDS